MRKFLLILLNFILFGCNENLDHIIPNKKVKYLFTTFCEEVHNSQYIDGKNVFIYPNSECNQDSCTIGIINIPALAKQELYGRFYYKGLTVYVDPNINPNIIRLNNYKHKTPINYNNNELQGPKEFIELWLYIKKDQIRYMKLNYQEGSSKDWELVEK